MYIIIYDLLILPVWYERWDDLSFHTQTLLHRVVFSHYNGRRIGTTTLEIPTMSVMSVSFRFSLAWHWRDLVCTSLRLQTSLASSQVRFLKKNYLEEPFAKGRMSKSKGNNNAFSSDIQYFLSIHFIYFTSYVDGGWMEERGCLHYYTVIVMMIWFPMFYIHHRHRHQPNQPHRKGKIWYGNFREILSIVVAGYVQSTSLVFDWMARVGFEFDFKSFW